MALRLNVCSQPLFFLTWLITVSHAGIPPIYLLHASRIIYEPPVICQIVFCWFILLAEASILKVMITSPGYAVIDKIDKDQFEEMKKSTTKFEKYDFCFKCKSPKPPRSHHCSKCRRCVLEMDHHCPWLNNCIGGQNMHHFVQVLMNGGFLAVSTLIYAVLMLYLFKPNDNLEKSSFFFRYKYLIIHAVSLLAVLFTIQMIAMVSFQISMLVENSSTIEMLKKRNSLSRPKPSKESVKSADSKECSGNQPENENQPSNDHTHVHHSCCHNPGASFKQMFDKMSELFQTKNVFMWTLPLNIETKQI